MTIDCVKQLCPLSDIISITPWLTQHALLTDAVVVCTTATTVLTAVSSAAFVLDFALQSLPRDIPCTIISQALGQQHPKAEGPSEDSGDESPEDSKFFVSQPRFKRRPNLKGAGVSIPHQATDNHNPFSGFLGHRLGFISKLFLKKNVL